MIQHALQYNRHRARYRYVLNETTDLRQFGGETFDLVYTNITLQHLEPRYATGYITEFLRITVPCRLKSVSPARLLALYRALRQLALREPGWEIHGIPRADVVALVERHGGRVVRVEEAFNPRRGWTDCEYYVTKSSGTIAP